MSTYEELIERAYGTSFKNRPETIATSETELLSVATRRVVELVALAATVNPVLFGTVSLPSFASGGWLLPTDAEFIYYLAHAGAEVVSVPYDDRAIDLLIPKVYQRGSQFLPTGQSGDPSSGTLDIWYSRAATIPADITEAVDAAWPSRFDWAITNEIAAYLAEKDSRPEQAQVFREEAGKWQGLFLAWAESQNGVEMRRIGVTRRRATPVVLPARGAGEQAR